MHVTTVKIRMKRNLFRSLKAVLSPERDPDLSPVLDYQLKHLPTLWVLGKTGAGKSSLISGLTGLNSVEIGNGFAPCTKGSLSYNYPEGKPVLQFLDTRGLSEAGYNADEDIALASNASHMLMVVAKLDDPEQSAVIDALRQIRKSAKIKHILVVHTAVLQIPENDRQRMITHNQSLFEAAWCNEIDFVAVDFLPPDGGQSFQLDELTKKLSSKLPEIHWMLDKEQHSILIAANWDKLKTEVLWYSSIASTSDLIPIAGLVSVPAIQAKMLHSIAHRYGVEFTGKIFRDFLAAMGTGFLLQYGSRLGVRQLAKLIPGYGQTVGAISAAVISYAISYSLGRAAAYYFYKIGQNEPINKAELKRIYDETLADVKKSKPNE